MSNELPLRRNVPEFSVSELAFSLKRTLEENYARVRVRGELSGVKLHSSGHLYAKLKDEEAVVDAVCWKGTVVKLSVRPEEGLEVICTGRITTYPARSNYQLVIESMELAGEGALLKMLEERKKKLAAEGLFDPARKRKIPFLPDRIGVITSPTGAVIRDILHRLSDRFPRSVLVWPVAVQGEGAENQIAGAIAGFNNLPENMRPDVLIVARGGGSLEDLMAFNAENVVRAAAESKIPLISAVGHETDTTLIDFAADLRAPTPTAAAEMAVPMRDNLVAQVQEDSLRLQKSVIRLLNERKQKIETLAAKLGDPTRLLDIKTQRLDHTGERLSAVFLNYIAGKDKKLASLAIVPPRSILREKGQIYDRWREKLDNAVLISLEERRKRLENLSKMLDLLSFENVLNRGFVVVWGDDGRPITDPDSLKSGQNAELQYKKQKKVRVSVR